MATLALEPETAIAQGPPPQGTGSNLQDRVAVLEAALEAEILAREDADRAEEELRRRADEEEAANREAGDQALQDSLTALTDVLCQAIQRMAGNPSSEAIALCGEALFKTVFVTSTTHTGDLKAEGGGATGLAGADNICNARAGEASLPGTYTAWLSTNATDARDRVTQASVPYLQTNGIKIADNFADLVDCTDTCLDSNLHIK